MKIKLKTALKLKSDLKELIELTKGQALKNGSYLTDDHELSMKQMYGALKDIESQLDKISIEFDFETNYLKRYRFKAVEKEPAMTPELEAQILKDFDALKEGS